VAEHLLHGFICGRPTDAPDQVRREPQRGPGKHSREGPNVFTGRELLNFSFQNSTFWRSPPLYISGRRRGPFKRRGARGTLPSLPYPLDGSAPDVNRRSEQGLRMGSETSAATLATSSEDSRTESRSCQAQCQGPFLRSRLVVSHSADASGLHHILSAHVNATNQNFPQFSEWY